MLSKEQEADALRLHYAEKWPIGTIARQLGVHHTSVQRVLRQGGVEANVVNPRASITDSYKPLIVEQLEKYPKLRASRLYEMAKERGYRGGADHFRKVVARFRPRRPAEAYQRLRTLPGEQGQVDWAHFGKHPVGAATRVLWAFVMVLSYSRQVYLRFFWGSAMPQFLRGHVDAFESFGGAPRVLLYDNLKSSTDRRYWQRMRGRGVEVSRLRRRDTLRGWPRARLKLAAIADSIVSQRRLRRAASFCVGQRSEAATLAVSLRGSARCSMRPTPNRLKLACSEQ